MRKTTQRAPRPPTAAAVAEACTGARALAESLGAAIAELELQVEGMQDRFAASQASLAKSAEEGMAALDDLARRFVLAELSAASHTRNKSLSAQNDAEKTSSEQLLASAAASETALAVSDLLLARASLNSISGLWSVAPTSPSVCVFLTTVATPAAAALGAWGRIRDEVSPSHTVLSGSGFAGYLSGDSEGARAYNTIHVCLRDGEEEDIPVAPANVRADVTSGSVVVHVLGPGSLEMSYCITASVTSVNFSLRVFGVPLAGSPFTIRPAALEGSAILGKLDARLRVPFIRSLTTQWLSAQTHTLIYRGTRDGLTASAFHAHCDGRKPTLTIVRSEEGFAFGGYTTVAWTSAPEGFASCPDAFLFSVHGPYGGNVRFPIRKGQAHRAMYQYFAHGPNFGGGHGITLLSGTKSGSGTFSAASHASLGVVFVDVVGAGERTFTGNRTFCPTEVEVYLTE